MGEGAHGVLEWVGAWGPLLVHAGCGVCVAWSCDVLALGPLGVLTMPSSAGLRLPHLPLYGWVFFKGVVSPAVSGP